MKINYLIMGLVGGAVLSLAACSKTDDVTPSSNVDAYMTLQLVGPQGSTQTRTVAGEDKTEVGTALENKISDIQILLCDPATKAVKYVYPVASGLVETNDGAKTKPIKVQTGTFDVYVIANPGSAALAVGADPTVKTIDAVTEELMKTAYAADNKFIMFNECNGSDKTAGTPITIVEGNDYDHPAVCEPIKLDRLAVQIRTKAETVNVDAVKTEGSFITAATLKAYRLLNGATKVNLQQKWSNTFEGQGSTYPWFNLLNTPKLAAGTNAQAGEYYNHLTAFRTVVKDVDDENVETYKTVKDLFESVPAYSDGGKIYCMENNPSYQEGTAAEALMGNTTGLVYQFQTTVEGSDKLAGDNCFYGYDGKYYATLAALQAANNGAFKASGKDGAEAQLAAAKEELTAATTEDGISAFRTKYNVKVYKNGIMYYTYFIKDKNYKNAADGARYYSVMRNTIYDLNVTELKRIGTDIPGGWNPEVDPEDPVDSKDVYMVVEVKVNPWVLSREDISLK